MRKRIPFFIFLFGYVLFSFGTYRDYGFTWDERDVYKQGFFLSQYYQKQFHLFAAPPKEVMDPEHNFPYAVLLNWLNPSFDWFNYHLLNLLFAALLLWGAYEVLLPRVARSWLALAGPLFLFLDLPFTGSVPGNPKDIPFAIGYFLALVLVYLFNEHKTLWWVRGLVLGAVIGWTMSSRIVGVGLFLVWVIFEVGCFMFERGKTASAPRAFEKWAGIQLLTVLLAAVVCLTACSVLWPYLGTDLWQHLVNVLWLSDNFPPHFQFLFQGHLVDTLNYPWYYIPFLIALTVPLFIWLLALGAIIGHLKDRLVWLMAVGLAVNLGFFLFFKPAIYDGLRHALYLLPMVGLLGAIGFLECVKRCEQNRAWALALGAVGLNALLVVIQIFRLHPYEYVYFNELAGGLPGAYGRYETDYWGASLREGVEWLKAHEATDPKRTYKVFAQGNPFQSIPFFAPNMKPFAMEEADYALLINRAGGKPDPAQMSQVIHRVEREGVPLCFILKLK